MANWNSIPLKITYEVLGWTAFVSWSISFYPQVILNFRRKRYFLYRNKFPTFFFFLSLDFVFQLIHVLFLNFIIWVCCWGCERSVVGLNFDFVVLNLTKHSSYLIYNAALYFSYAIQKQYFEKYGRDQVRAFFLLN